MRGGWKSISTAEISCFIDTGVFFAAYNKNDAIHVDGTLLLLSSVIGWLGKPYTSTYVFDETLTLAKARIGGREANELGEYILASKKIMMVKVEDKEDILQNAMEKFRRYSNVEGLSFTDCTTLSLQERLGIESLLSFDKNLKPFVSKLIGEGYHKGLPDERKKLLAKVTKKLGIKLKLP